MISKHLFVLLACLFVVMIGLGITMPVLPLYVERLALGGGASRQASGRRSRPVAALIGFRKVKE